MDQDEDWRNELVAEHLAVAGKILAARGPGIDSCLLIGSLAAGYGTTRSDVDLLTFTGEADSLPGASAGEYSGERRVDVEHLRLSEALALIESLGSYQVLESDVSQLYRANDALELFCRLMSSPRVLRDSAGLRSLLARCRSVAESATRIRVSRATLLANNTLEDALGFLEIGDVRSALHSSGTMLHFGMDALCSALGDTFFGQKWNVQRVGSVLSRNPAYRQGLFALLDSGDTQTPSAVLRRIEISQQLLAVANVTVWEPATVHLRLPRFEAPRNAYRRDRHWYLLKYDARWAMSDGRRSYQVPWTAVLVWGLAGGLAEDELVEAGREEIGRAVGRQIPSALPLSLVHRLRELGALTTGAGGR
ncbi:hypothetical protein AB0912_31425 [Streptomyces sp. NPDC007084]|uniref:hypothetical protein n=1 Tax=Streptomyces sp. NPDC007084 TaxID=3154313 RepID=UPI003453B7AE